MGKIIEFETFSPPGQMAIISMRQNVPSAFNSIVRIKRYRVTIEEIDEPIEILRERLLQLCRVCDNHHEWGALKAQAKDLGMDSTNDALQMGRDCQEKPEKRRKKQVRK